MFSRGKAKEAAKEVYEYLAVIDNVRALQESQKEIADAIQKIGERIVVLEASLATIKMEARYESLR